LADYCIIITNTLIKKPQDMGIIAVICSILVDG